MEHWQRKGDKRHRRLPLIPVSYLKELPTLNNVTLRLKPGKYRAYKVRLVLVLLLIGLKDWREIFQPITNCSNGVIHFRESFENNSNQWLLCIYPVEAPKTFFGLNCDCLNRNHNCDDHTFISFVCPQFT